MVQVTHRSHMLSSSSDFPDEFWLGYHFAEMGSVVADGGDSKWSSSHDFRKSSLWFVIIRESVVSADEYVQIIVPRKFPFFQVFILSQLKDRLYRKAQRSSADFGRYQYAAIKNQTPCVQNSKNLTGFKFKNINTKIDIETSQK